MKKQKYYNLNGISDNFFALYGENTAEQKNRYQNLFDTFKNTFNTDSGYIVSSPGRVEVCGNHVDHNGGKVISTAISLDSLAVFLPTDDNAVTIYSEGYGKIFVDLDKPCEKESSSKALVYGVAEGLKNLGYKVGGFIACMTSNVAGGAGISSSASFEVLVSEVFNFLYNESKIDCETKAIVSQYAENVYFLKPCGLLDQTAISFGGLNRLDFKTVGKITVDKIEDDLKDYSLVLINTGGSHENLTDEYASIPREMKQVASVMGVERLIEKTQEEFIKFLPTIKEKVTDRAVNRAVHFYQENERVDIAYSALKNKDYLSFIKAVNDSGISSAVKLQNCYVSGSDEQPIIKALSISSLFNKNGANRVHGGGFAGTILNVVKNDELEQFLSNIYTCYDKSNVYVLKVRACGAIVL